MSEIVRLFRFRSRIRITSHRAGSVRRLQPSESSSALICCTGPPAKGPTGHGAARWRSECVAALKSGTGVQRHRLPSTTSVRRSLAIARSPTPAGRARPPPARRLSPAAVRPQHPARGPCSLHLPAMATRASHPACRQVRSCRVEGSWWNAGSAHPVPARAASLTPPWPASCAIRRAPARHPRHRPGRRGRGYRPAACPPRAGPQRPAWHGSSGRMHRDHCEHGQCV